MSGEQHWQTYEPTGRSGARDESGRPRRAPPKKVERPRPSPRRESKPGTGLKILVFGVAPVVFVTGLGTIMYLGSDHDGVPGFGKPDALSADGLDQLRADIRERTGRTEVFRAVIYPGYASVDLPVDTRTQRSESVYWDGDLDDFDNKGTSSYVRVDLADVDADVLVDAVETAKTLVEDPKSWYVIIGGPSTPSSADEDPDPPSITAYASNEFSESGYVELTFDGTEIRRVEPELP